MSTSSQNPAPPQVGDTVRLPDGSAHVVTSTWMSGRDLRVELDNGVSRFAGSVTVITRAGQQGGGAR